jgi:hypothetical protein
MSSTEAAAPETPAVEPEVVTPPAEASDQQPPALVPASGKAPMVVSDRGVQLRSFAELWRFAQMALQGGAAPKGMKTVGQVAVAIQTGMEAGLTPMHALQAIVVINGNTSWKGQSALGLIRSNPRCKYIRAWSEGKGDDMKGVCVSLRAGAPKEERTEFTVEQAKTAELWKKRGREGEPTPWITYPDRQLMWRAVGFHAKDHWSEVLGGFPIAEEAQDYPDREPVRVVSSSPPPSTPDPLLVDAVVVDVVTAPTGDPALAEDFVLVPPTEKPKAIVKDCPHPAIPPSRLKPGKTMVCVDCGTELTGDPIQP